MDVRVQEPELREKMEGRINTNCSGGCGVTGEAPGLLNVAYVRWRVRCHDHEWKEVEKSVASLRKGRSALLVLNKYIMP